MNLFDMIRSQMQASVPFAKHNGIEVSAMADGYGEAVLRETPQSLNHVGSQQAGALFTVGETASGAAMMGAFAARATSIIPLATRADIAYRKVARGTITAKARTSLPGADLLATLDSEGKAAFDVAVDLVNEAGETVGEMKVAWHVRGREEKQKS